MPEEQREIQRKLRILRYAEDISHVAKTCRYFGTGRTSFYRWRKDYAERGEAGLINAPPIPKRHANSTPAPLQKKFFILDAHTTWGQCGSFGILSDTTTYGSLTQR